MTTYHHLRRCLNVCIARAAKHVFNQIEWLEAKIAARRDARTSSPDSPVRFDILGAMIQLAPVALPLHGFPHSGPADALSLWRMRKALRSVDRNPAAPKTQISTADLQAVEALARTLGVSSIGYTDVPQELIFHDKGVLYAHALVITMPMDQQAIARAPSVTTAAEVHRVYAAESLAVNRLAEELRARGYGAQAGYPLLGLALYPPLAQRAGLGWRGAHGLLITPEHGPRVRLAAVFTSICNLPKPQPEAHRWIETYCARCRRCVAACPAQAIYAQPIARINGLVTCIDNARCFPQFAEHHGCGVCLRVCPFSQTAYQKLQRHQSHHQPEPGSALPLEPRAHHSGA